MISKIVFRFIIIFLIIVLLSGAAIWVIRTLPRPVLEYAINQNAREFLDGPLSIERVRLGGDLRISIAGVRGALRTREGAVSFEIGSIDSTDPLYHFFSGNPVRFIFSGVRPKGSPRSGISGECSFLAEKKWRFELTADLGGADLEDLRWLDPNDLSGATGAMKGKFTFVQSADEEPIFGMQLEAPEPGGMLQARFFDIFLPYLPASIQKDRVSKLAAEGEQLVRYQTAGLEVTMPQTDQLKVLLRILVLDYNLKLTLNATIRTDAKNTFSQVARLMGLIEVKL